MVSANLKIFGTRSAYALARNLPNPYGKTVKH